MREAVVRLSDAELAALGFGELVSHCREAGIRDIDMLEDDGYSCTPQIEVESKLDEDLLADLEWSTTGSWWWNERTATCTCSN